MAPLLASSWNTAYCTADSRIISWTATSFFLICGGAGRGS
jgi:hypothetical protein